MKACVTSQKKCRPEAEQIYFIPAAAQFRLPSLLLQQVFTIPSEVLAPDMSGRRILPCALCQEE